MASTKLVVLMLVLFPLQCSTYAVAALTTWNVTKGLTMTPDVNSLTSVDAIIPFEHYSLQYCRSSKKNKANVNLGMMLKGDILESSLYEFNVLKNESCKVLTCESGEDVLSVKAIKKFNEFIRRGYRSNMVLDNLPLIASDAARGMALKKFCHDERNPLRSAPEVRGAAIGGCEQDRVFLHNHHDFMIHYNYRSPDEIFVVGFEVFPRSVRTPDCSKKTGRFFVETNQTTPKKVHWSYSVTWIEKPSSRWATRWDYYLQNSGAASEAAPHWRLITQSLLVLLCLSSIVVLILMRTLRRDIDRYGTMKARMKEIKSSEGKKKKNKNNRYHEIDSTEDQEVTGWKWLAGDVFRPPPFPKLFAGVIGTGTQLGGMLVTLLCAAVFGFLSPSYRGAIVTTTISLFAAMSLLNGYATGALLSLFHCKSWVVVMRSAAAFPAFCCAVWIICEMFLSMHGASNVVTVPIAMSIIAAWLGICIPLAVVGASISFRQWDISLSYNELARRVPSQRCIFHMLPTIFLPGIIPYAAAHVEIRLIMRAIWQGQVYHVFGFLSLVFAVVVITASLTVVVYVYHLLLAEDHRWWWRSFLASSGMGIYFLMYCITYYHTVLKASTWTATVVYFSFCITSALSLSVLVGVCGFFTSWVFIRSMYSYLKID
eukprot:TRINITY_DN10783_c0_g1_i2.p1 TRINITY_DN10783_c0_g1~~TRINITY_DN10783_c0_g1_i2.p1  ORF type:complete len:670 (+),score=67.67 TRINITY_DN10783_c0_g1_i2:51-2012(+)